MQPQNQPQHHGLHWPISQESRIQFLSECVDLINDMVEAPNQPTQADHLSYRLFPPGTHHQLRRIQLPNLNPSSPRKSQIERSNGGEIGQESLRIIQQREHIEAEPDRFTARRNLDQTLKSRSPDSLTGLARFFPTSFPGRDSRTEDLLPPGHGKTDN